MTSTKSHTGFCRQSRSAYYEKKASFIHHWPLYCKTCSGLGGKYEMFDPSPSGVELGGGHMTEFIECQDCLAQTICPRCGFAQVDIGEHFEDVVCENCEWDQHEAEMDMNGEYCLPERPECSCFAEEEYQETYEELEQLTELEVDLANDPDRQMRQDDADDALMFLIGSNGDNDEGD